MTYYFDITEAKNGKLIVLSSVLWMKVWKERRPGWLHIWEHGTFDNLVKAQEHFQKQLDSHDTLE